MPNIDHFSVGAPCWVDLWTSDVEGSRAFYAQLFGWEAMEPSEEFGGYFMFHRDGLPIAGGMGDRRGEQVVEPVVGSGGVDRQGAVLQLASSLAHPDRPSQMVADFRREDRIAAVDGVLHVAQNVGNADLVIAAELLLAGVEVGYPHIGLVPPSTSSATAPRRARSRCLPISHRSTSRSTI